MVELSKHNAEHEGVAGRATFVQADLFRTDLSKASVITMFLLPEINLKLRPKILALKPGTRIVSNTFTMGDWTADEKATVENDCTGSWCTALLWIVPARVAGTYEIPQGELTLKQRFQMLSGTLRTEGKTFALKGRVRGDEVSFTAGGHSYSGKANGKQLEEIHGDGTLTAPFFVVPESMLSPGNSSPPPLRELYVIVNSKLGPDFEMPGRTIASVLGRAIAIALTSALRAEVALIYVGAQQHKIGLHMAHVDPTFSHPMRGPFDGKYMQALYDVGVAAGKNGTAFEDALPAISGSTNAQ